MSIAAAENPTPLLAFRLENRLHPSGNPTTGIAGVLAGALRALGAGDRSSERLKLSSHSPENFGHQFCDSVGRLRVAGVH